MYVEFITIYRYARCNRKTSQKQMSVRRSAMKIWHGKQILLLLLLNPASKTGGNAGTSAQNPDVFARLTREHLILGDTEERKIENHVKIAIQKLH